VLKAGTMRGCLVNNQNLNLRGLNPLFLSLCSSILKRELERELREKEKIEVVARRSSLDHQSCCKVYHYIFLPCN